MKCLFQLCRCNGSKDIGGMRLHPNPFEQSCFSFIQRGTAIGPYINKLSCLLLTAGELISNWPVCARARIVLEILPAGLFDLRVNLFQSIREMLGGLHRQLTSLLCRVCTKSHLCKITWNTQSQCRMSQCVGHRAAVAGWK